LGEGLKRLGPIGKPSEGPAESYAIKQESGGKMLHAKRGETATGEANQQHGQAAKIMARHVRIQVSKAAAPGRSGP